MKNSLKVTVTILLSLAALLIAAGVGSVYIPPPDSLRIILHKLLGVGTLEGVDPTLASILWSIRLPRAASAFLVGAALSVSGVVMQSTLQNPLASSYTLGVSAGAALGAAFVIVSGFTLPLIGGLTMPLVAFLAGLATVLLAIGMASRLDKSLQSGTVILVGMVFSLFVNAILTLVSTLQSNYLQQLVVWQMGSFSGLNWREAGIILCTLVPCSLLVVARGREMDIMTFGADQSLALGVKVRSVKLLLVVLSALLTGVSVCFTGTIGFVDLVSPHITRRIFGPRHRLLVPMSMLIGGSFLTLADLVARTVLSPIDLPVGAVTALIGAPFFAYIFFQRRKEAAA